MMESLHTFTEDVALLASFSFFCCCYHCCWSCYYFCCFGFLLFPFSILIFFIILKFSTLYDYLDKRELYIQLAWLQEMLNGNYKNSFQMYDDFEDIDNYDNVRMLMACSFTFHNIISAFHFNFCALWFITILLVHY